MLNQIDKNKGVSETCLTGWNNYSYFVESN